MKITNLTLYKVPPRWLFLKIDTDEGISGWGEPVIEGRADTVRTAVDYNVLMQSRNREQSGLLTLFLRLYQNKFS